MPLFFIVPKMHHYAMYIIICESSAKWFIGIIKSATKLPKINQDIQYIIIVAGKSDQYI